MKYKDRVFMYMPDHLNLITNIFVDVKDDVMLTA